MSDLISRKAAIEIIENLCVDGKMYGNEGMTLIDAYEAIDGISDLPTAFSVEEVVKQLRDGDIGVIETEDAIEIVKGGGQGE